MKRLSLIAALVAGVALSCFTANAQDAVDKKVGKRPGAPAEQQLQRLSKELELTDAQKPKVKALLADTQKKRQELLKDTSMIPRERRAKMAGLIQEQDKKLKEILTPVQYDKFEKAREEGRKKAKDKAPGEKKGRKRNL